LLADITGKNFLITDFLMSGAAESPNSGKTKVRELFSKWKIAVEIYGRFEWLGNRRQEWDPLVVSVGGENMAFLPLESLICRLMFKPCVNIEKIMVRTRKSSCKIDILSRRRDGLEGF
jgi:hypothetical protein